MKDPSPEVARGADVGISFQKEEGIKSEKDACDFARTKHDDLPEKKKKL